MWQLKFFITYTMKKTTAVFIGGFIMIYSSKLQWKDITLFLVADETALLSIGFREPDGVIWEENEIILQCKAELQEYFTGQRKAFDVSISFNGTDFQNAVWQKLLEIPYGRVMSYSNLAKAIGKPKAARAIGNACNKNPIAVIIPCHRVVGKNGSLTGYAGGIGIKEKLLEIEKKSLK